MMLQPRTAQRAGTAFALTACLLSSGRGTAADEIRPVNCHCGAGHVSGAAGLGNRHATPVMEFGSPGGILSAAPAVVTVPPPPGTLGTTYQRRSWRIPADRHPRIAMLDVRAPAGATDLHVYTTYEYREEDEIEGFQDLDDPCLWHFESKPLIPGIPHVYRVEATVNGAPDARFVRLIRGRRVTLEY